MVKKQLHRIKFHWWYERSKPKFNLQNFFFFWQYFIHIFAVFHKHFYSIFTCHTFTAFSHIYNFLIYLTLSIFKSSQEDISVEFFFWKGGGAIKFKIQNKTRLLLKFLEKKILNNYKPPLIKIWSDVCTTMQFMMFYQEFCL